MWYIACPTPVPRLIPKRPGAVRVVRQPLYDTRTLGPAPAEKPLLFMGNPAVYKANPKKGEPKGPLPVYWQGDVGERTVTRQEWCSDPTACKGYSTKEEAERVAFELTVERPELVGAIYVVKL